MIYADYNATFPPALRVRSFLAEQDFIFANASSQHFLGKRSLGLINGTRDYILQMFNASISFEREVLFHSGATEGVNLFLHSCFHQHHFLKKDVQFYHSPIDHSAVLESVAFYKNLGLPTTVLSLDTTFLDGRIDLGFFEDCLKKSTNLGEKVWLTTTWAHHELGFVENVKAIAALKKKYFFYWHIDATQTIGKIFSFNHLLPEMDLVTYSGHKFGSLMGVGFSLFHKEMEKILVGQLHGGGQQGKLRSGTLNVEGIYSMQLALAEWQSSSSPIDKMLLVANWRSKLNEKCKNILGANGIVFSSSAIETQMINTISFAVKDLKSDIALASFDLAGLAIGTGAACVSGRFLPSKTLIELGHNKWSENVLRISFSPVISEKDFQLFETQFLETLIRLLGAGV